MEIPPRVTASTPTRRETWGLGCLFGILYFVQGIAEPTEGLIAQPVRSLLHEWGFAAQAIGAFAWGISAPWWLKPIYGFLSDFVPLAGFRRKSYLSLASGSASVSLLLLFFWPPAAGALGWLLVGLLVPTVGVAVADVVVDALMVEKGQPLGLTGRLQSIQWSAMYSATILTGSLGGWLAQQQLQHWGFLICGLVMLPTVVLALLAVREAPAPPLAGNWRDELRSLRATMGDPMLWALSGFLLLWNLNPFSATVLQLYATNELKLSEQFFGHTISLQAMGAVAASIAYAFYCRRVPFAWLVHGSILCGIAATVSYWLIHDEASTAAVSLVVGFTYMTGSLIQMDLAARICPVQVAASVFALLMAVSNVGLSLSHLLGGYLYDLAAIPWDRPTSFRLLVAAGALTTAGCWLLVPKLTSTPSQRE